ncbi:hypothetical protein SDC9_76361 [bioreactor metagenome]|uniref:Uncharacterized protein n=1 Tax=bioreactor metagenome TaxID=1076179 RepID=A0A644YN10_9ZZZZ|nr:LPXTG cell wall anchor domain-containing protein [Oscillospiraceae bacterium]
MKRTIAFLMAALFALSVCGIYASAAGEKALTMSLEKPAGYESATSVECENFVDAAGNYTGHQDQGPYDYVYLKKEADNPHATIKFSVTEDGTYDFLVEIMAYTTAIPRTGLVQIDSGEKFYIGSTHGDRNLITEYYTGMSAELKAGDHTFTIYLADDFDNTTVKSLFFDKFNFVKKADAPKEEPIEEPKEEPKDDTTAPSTGDNTVVFALTGIAALISVVVITKKKAK